MMVFYLMGSPIFEKHGLSKEEFIKQIRDMTNKDKSIPEIATYFETSGATIHNWMKKYGIQRRTQLRNPKWLIEQYVDRHRSCNNIAEELGVTEQAVMWHLKKMVLRYGVIGRHSRSEIAAKKSTKILG